MKQLYILYTFKRIIDNSVAMLQDDKLIIYYIMYKLIYEGGRHFETKI